MVDTTNNRILVGDNSTAGGWPAAKLVETITNGRTPVPDATYTALITDRLIAYTALSASRTVNLPSAGASGLPAGNPTSGGYPTGTRLLIIDESGNCSATKPIIITPNGSNTIEGANSSAVIAMPYGFIGLESNGAGGWFVTDQLVAASAPNGANMQFFVKEFLQSALLGSSVICGTQLPAPALILSVGAYVTTTITGSGSPTGFNVGDQASQGDSGASATRFANGVGLAYQSSSAGIAGSPFYNWEATNIVLAPAGGLSPSFTAGAVRISIHYAVMNPSNS